MITVAPNLKSIIDRDGAVILDISRNSITTLDTIGAYIWERLEKGLAVDATVAELVRDTAADEMIVAQDVHEFIEQLQTMNLVSSSSNSSEARRF